MTDIFELIEQAQSDLNVYKHPNLTEVSERLSEILMAGGLGSLEYDKIESLEIRDDILEINTSYSLRSCVMSGEYKIPCYVLRSENPLEAIKKDSKERKIDEARREVREAEQALAFAKQDLEELLENE